MVRNNNDAIWVHIALWGALLFHFSRNTCDSTIPDSIVRNRTKLSCSILTLKDDIYKFCRHSLPGGAVVTFS